MAAKRREESASVCCSPSISGAPAILEVLATPLGLFVLLCRVV